MKKVTFSKEFEKSGCVVERRREETVVINGSSLCPLKGIRQCRQMEKQVHKMKPVQVVKQSESFEKSLNKKKWTSSSITAAASAGTTTITE